MAFLKNLLKIKRVTKYKKSFKIQYKIPPKLLIMGAWLLVVEPCLLIIATGVGFVFYRQHLLTILTIFFYIFRPCCDEVS